MPAVDLDRQAIERRDFPIGRRGYDPVAVDAHLRAVAVEIEELQRTADHGRGDLSLASTAGSQVQSILQATETAAAEIESQAAEAARQVREAADRDAERTREEAIEKARAHVAAVAQVATTLLERAGAMDAEVRAFVDSVRAGAGRLAGDLAAVDTNMGELYDAASGAAATGAAAPQRAKGQSDAAPAATPSAAAQPPSASEVPAAPARATAARAAGSELVDAPVAAPAGVPAEAPAGADQRPGGAPDLDGARLIALNMALNGESRADTERYLAENFQLPDRAKLISEVYAAIEG
jgi:hypothetical protein